MYEVALKRLGSKPEETIVVGDRLETDIAGAQALGCPTALVLSGVATREQAEAWLPRPDFIVSDLTELLSRI
jgi:4-nitrophenyl phosphatase